MTTATELHAPALPAHHSRLHDPAQGATAVPDSEDGDFDDVDPTTAAADITAYQAEMVTARANTSAGSDLAAPVRGRRRSKPINLRWILVHLIEEYARHLGHMDLLRESIDGSTGY